MTFLDKIVFISLTFYSIINHGRSIDEDYDNTGRIPNYIHRRQDTIPVIYAKGSHYDIGYMIGQTFGCVMKSFIKAYEPLKVYLKIYETSDVGKQVYLESLEATNKYFPQYLVELKGMADGADISFHELFLIHLDDILTSNVQDTRTNIGIGPGCSSIMVNRPCRNLFIGHNEDALNATVNHFYIINAHIIPTSNEYGGIFPAREEHWEAMTYAASLSGYASGYNCYGVIMSINTIFAKHLVRGNIPRVFLARAMLASKADINEIQKILTNEGTGTADAFHVNIALLNNKYNCHPEFYSIEVTPSYTEKKSDLYIEKIASGSTSFHVNRLHNGSNFEELRESGWWSSIARQKRYEELTLNNPVKTVNDILRVLEDTKNKKWQIFRGSPDDFVNTINLGVFDLHKMTWTLWTNNPKTNPPLIKLPLKCKTCICPKNRAIKYKP